MKKIITLFFIFYVASLGIYAQQQSVRWKETERRGIDDKPVPYTDTFYLQISDTKEWRMRRGSFMYKGTVNKRRLEFPDRTYKILHNDNTEIWLEDEDHILSVFKPDAKDNSAGDAAQFAKQNELPETAAVNIDRSLLNGKWTAYKRSTRDGKPMQDIDYNSLIKSMEIYGLPDSAGNTGIAFNSAGMMGKPTFYIISIENAIISYKDRRGDTHVMKILRSDNKELIAEGDNGVIYFFRH